MDHHRESNAAMAGVGAGPVCCAGCGAAIFERFYLKALDKVWHEDCLKCACCDCRLGEVASTCYEKANLIFCRRDYLRLFGNNGNCTSCNKAIPAFELVMRANGNVYHLECFACQECNYRFCVGDRFYLWDNNKILCESDYEDRLLLTTGSTGGGQSHHAVMNDHNNHIGHNHINSMGAGCHSLRGCMPHPVIVPNHHLTCIVNEPMEMARNEQKYLTN